MKTWIQKLPFLVSICAVISFPFSKTFCNTSAREVSKSFIAAAKTCEASVVSVKSVAKKQTKNWKHGDGAPDFSSPEEFWEHFFGPQEIHSGPKIAYGSGFIVSTDGYILTNNHVVDHGDDIVITLPGGKEYPAKKIGGDFSTDIAILKIDAQNLQPLLFADSSSVEVGEWVLAIGNPFGLEATVTSGIISAKCRTDLDITVVERYFQTDAAINVGNSGGPLVNLDGQVVGMNTAIASNTGGYIGIGFAIQSNLLQEVMRELIASGHLTKGYLGLALQKVTSDIASAVGLPEPKGALVSDVMSGSPADMAGIQSGDIITALDGVAIESVGTLRNAIVLIKPGQVVTLTIRRNGSDMTFKATVSKHPENTSDSTLVIEKLGFSLETVTPEIAKKYNLDTKNGLLITEIDPESKSYQSGLRPGYVILAVNGKIVTSIDDFAQHIAATGKGSKVLLQVKIGTSLRFVPLTI